MSSSIFGTARRRRTNVRHLANRKLNCTRRIAFEPLEDRCVLSSFLPAIDSWDTDMISYPLNWGVPGVTMHAQNFSTASTGTRSIHNAANLVSIVFGLNKQETVTGVRGTLPSHLVPYDGWYSINVSGTADAVASAVGGDVLVGANKAIFRGWLESRIMDGGVPLTGFPVAETLLYNKTYEFSEFLQDSAWTVIKGAASAASGGIYAYAQVADFIIQAAQGIAGVWEPMYEGEFSITNTVYLTAGKTYSWDVSTHSMIGSAAIGASGNAATATLNVIINEVSVEPISLPVTYTLFALAGDNGTLSPGGAIVVRPDSSLSLVAEPNWGYEVDRWTLNGAPLAENVPSVSFSGFANSMTLHVSFKKSFSSPDLIPLFLTVNDTSLDVGIERGDEISVNLGVLNCGNSPSGPSKARVYWSTHPTNFTNATPLWTVDVPALQPGSGSGYSMMISTPDDAVPGTTYHVGVMVDYLNQVDEGNWEYNNSSHGIPVTIDDEESAFIVTSPALYHYEVWISETTQEIKWHSQGNPGSHVRIDLEYLSPFGYDGTWVFDREIVAWTLNTGSFLWEIPDVLYPGESRRVVITSTANPEIRGESDVFWVWPREQLHVGAPASGEVWKPGTTQLITWGGVLHSANHALNIDLYRGSEYDQRIASSAPFYDRYAYGTGRYFEWSIPDDLEERDDYRIRLAVVERPSIFDIGGKFRIASVSPPTGVRASDGDFVDRVRVTWTPSPDAASYEVWRGSSNDPGTAIRISPNESPPTGTSFDDFGAVTGTQYWYWVKARFGTNGTTELSTGDSGYRGVVTPPAIDSLSAAPDPVTRPNQIVLTATGVSDPDGQVMQVRFYRDSNGDEAWDEGDELLEGTVEISNGDWSLSFSTAGWDLGAHTFFARAQDNDDAWSNVVSTAATVFNALPVIASLSVTPQLFAPHEEIALTAHGATDADGEIVLVEFYRDRNNDGVWDLNDEYIGAGVYDPENDDWTLTVSTDSWGLGEHTFFARARDNCGAWSEVVGGIATMIEPDGPKLTVFDDSGHLEDRTVGFPTTVLGSTSEPLTFTLSNIGDQTLHITNFAKGGTNPVEFEVLVRNDAGGLVAGTSYSIPADKSYMIEIRFQPIAPAGNKSATIIFNTDDPDAASVTLTMSGTAVPDERTLTNIAIMSRGATATADSTGSYSGTRYPHFAIDGDHDTIWGNSWAMPAWLQVEFDREYEIEQLGVRWGGHQHTFSVSVSLDGEYWTEAIAPRVSLQDPHYVDGQYVGGELTYELLAIQPTQARFIRMDITTTTAPDSHIFKAVVRELEAYAETWQNPNNPLDVGRNGVVQPYDVLLLINEINRNGAGRLPVRTAGHQHLPYYDVNGDGLLTPLDVLMVITHLNLNSHPTDGSGGEGESATEWGYGSQMLFPLTTVSLADRQQPPWRRNSDEVSTAESVPAALVRQVFETPQWLDAERELPDWKTLADDRRADDDDLDAFFAAFDLHDSGSGFDLELNVE